MSSAEFAQGEIKVKGMNQECLIIKAPVTTAADDNFLFFYFSEKTSLDISYESSAWQMIHMKCQDLVFSEKKKKKKKLECRLLQI